MKMHLAPNMYKMKANAKNTTWKCMWHHICKTMNLKENSLLEHAFDSTSKIVSVKANQEIAAVKCIWQIQNVKANAKEIITWKCIWYVQNHVLWRQMPRKLSSMRLTPNTYPWLLFASSFTDAYVTKYVVGKCSWKDYSDKCDQVLYWHQLFFSAFTVQKSLLWRYA